MKILVAYDGSEQAQRALRWAARLAPDTKITVISVVPVLEASAKIVDAVDPTSDVPEHYRELAEAVTILEKSNVATETILKAGNPAEEIINAGADSAFDIILVGIRGMSSARRFLIGSVAERVVRHATIPVLVVR